MFFFLISKGYALKKAERHKAYREYTKRLGPQKTKTKRITSPKVDATHSRKPIREKASSPKYNLAQLHKLQTKKFFNF